MANIQETLFKARKILTILEITGKQLLHNRNLGNLFIFMADKSI